uniref:Uncharacterized protein n=1 Tax=Glossina palpalis gambiensis TaxID=67801 RepID=A0A1B0B5R5_9MUSC
MYLTSIYKYVYTPYDIKREPLKRGVVQYPTKMKSWKKNTVTQCFNKLLLCNAFEAHKQWRYDKRSPTLAGEVRNSKKFWSFQREKLTIQFRKQADRQLGPISQGQGYVLVMKFLGIILRAEKEFKPVYYVMAIRAKFPLFYIKFLIYVAFLLKVGGAINRTTASPFCMEILLYPDNQCTANTILSKTLRQNIDRERE